MVIVSILLIFFLLTIALGLYFSVFAVTLYLLSRDEPVHLWIHKHLFNRVQNGGKTSDIPLLIDSGLWQDWAWSAVIMLRKERELSAIELVQRKLDVSFEEARVRLFKMDEEFTVWTNG